MLPLEDDYHPLSGLKSSLEGVTRSAKNYPKVQPNFRESSREYVKTWSLATGPGSCSSAGKRLFPGCGELWNTRPTVRYEQPRLGVGLWFVPQMEKAG